MGYRVGIPNIANGTGGVQNSTNNRGEEMRYNIVMGVTLFESDDYGGWKVMSSISPTIRATKVCVGIIEVSKIENN